MSIKTKIATYILKNDLILYTMSSEKFFSYMHLIISSTRTINTHKFIDMKPNDGRWKLKK